MSRVEPTAPGIHRYLTLDHWRGFAALAVVLFHAFYPWAVEPPPWGFGWLARAVSRGFFGVHLFFVISGYCIAQLVLREIRARGSVGGFLRNRFLRIFPPYWAACLVAALLALIARPFNHVPLVSTANVPGVFPGSFGAAAMHAALLDPLRSSPGYLLVAWTLSWEISFYLVAGLVIAIGLRLSLPAAIGFWLLIAAAGTSPALAADWGVLRGWTEFTAGACVFAALTATREQRSPWPWLAVIALLSCASRLLAGPESFMPYSGAFALLLFWLHRYDEPLARVRPAAWLGRLGATSYSLYLIHVPVISPLRNLLGRFVSAQNPRFFLVLIACVLAGVAAGQCFFRWIEAPIERWRKSFNPSRGPVPLST